MSLTIVEDDSYLSTVNDPVLRAPVYFGRETTGLAGKEIAQIIATRNTSQPHYDLYLLDEDIWEFVNRPISKEAFEVLVRYYENNQQYYLHHQDWDNLTQLEMWFLQVVEPKHGDVAEWLDREKTKFKGYSWYSDHRIRKKVKVPTYITNQVKENYKVIT